jgi:hypothetical protein
VSGLDRVTGPVALKRLGGDEKTARLALPPPTIGSLREQVAVTADLSKVPRGRWRRLIHQRSRALT